MLQATPASEYAQSAPRPVKQVGCSVLPYLLVGKLAKICCSCGGPDLRVSVRLNANLLAFLAVLDVEEHVVITHVLICNGAE